jgi:hypothetical protein
MFFDAPPPQTRNCGTLIKGFNHIWEVYVPLGNLEYAVTSLPPPFEAYGAIASFVFKQCLGSHKGSCKEYTLQSATRQSQLTTEVFANYNSIFGITRNKRDALNTKKKRAAQEELEESEPELEYEESEVDDEEEEEVDEEVEEEEKDDEQEEETREQAEEEDDANSEDEK